jgi:hypothetical protein
MNETKITNCEKNSFANTKKNNWKKNLKAKNFFIKPSQLSWKIKWKK